MAEARKTRTRRPSTSADSVTAYAKGVVGGSVVAGHLVRAACARHLRDLEDGPGRGLKWDREAAKRAVQFFPDVLKLGGGGFEGAPFVLSPWEQFIVGSLYGWKRKDGFRRFRTAYCEIGKGNGKSPLAGGIGLLMLVADGEPRAEVYAAATKKDQAMILFRDAVAMVDQSPMLSQALHKSGGGHNVWNLAYLKNGSWFRPISNDDAQSGPRPHCGLVDELHEHRDDTSLDMMRRGTKGRRQALIFIITNSGHDRQSVCWQQHHYCSQVVRGEVENDSVFAYICTLDPCAKHMRDGSQQPVDGCEDCDDPFRSEDCWPKANPNLGVSIQPEYLRELVREGRGMPSARNKALRLNFCMWTEAFSSWIDVDRWEACQVEFDPAVFAGREITQGLDLSARTDLTALGNVVAQDDGTFDAWVEFWTPEDTLREREERDVVPYAVWRQQGHIHATPGRAVDYGFVGKRLGELAAQYAVTGCAFDRYKIDFLIKDMNALGVESWIDKGDGKDGTGLRMVSFGQGFKDMDPAVDALEEAVLNGTLRIRRNPCLTWCSANAVLEVDAAESRKFTKAKSTGRIDGIVALAMAFALAKAKTPDEQSFWEKEAA